MRTSLPILWAALLSGCPRPPAPLLALDADGLGSRASELVGEGGLRARLAPPDDAHLVLFYGGEQMGSMEPCGCARDPRGSLYRVEAYVGASARAGTPSLLLNTGYWLDDAIAPDESPRPDAAVANRWMVQGLEAGGWHALNLTTHDLPWLAHAGARPGAVVSANLRPRDPDAAWPPRALTFQVEGLEVAVTGVTGDSMAWYLPEGWTVEDPVQAVAAVAAQAEADLLVVLAHDIDAAAEAVFEVEGVDVLLEGDRYLERYPPYVRGGTLWVRSHHQTRRLGELRLRLEGGRIAAALDRRVDLDDRIPRGRATGALAHRALEEITAARLEAGP